MKPQVLYLLLVEFSFLLRGLYAVGNLTTTPETVNDTLTACPGDTLTLTCAHNNDGQVGGVITRWEVSGSTPCPILHDPPDIGEECGPFTFTMVNDAVGPETLISTAQATASASLNGIMVVCRAGSTSSSTVVGNITINVLDIPTPTIMSVEQVSQSEVRVNTSVADSQCVGSYLVNSTQISGGSIPSSALTSPSLVVSGLDVCRYNYSFEAVVVSDGGTQGDFSSPFFFSADLSVVNSTTLIINQMDPLIEWMQMDSLYPECITNFTITAGLLSTTVDSTTRNLTAQQLNTAGFPYCTTIHPTVTPLTPMGPLMTVQGSGDLYTNLIDPDFPVPMLNQIFDPLESVNDTCVVILLISIQDDLSSNVSIRSYWYTTNGTNSSVMTFAGDSFKIELPGAETGQVVTVTVMFENGPCQSMFSDSYTVPSKEIANLTQGQPTDTSQTVTITLPLTEYQPEQLLIISTVDPPDDGPIMANFTSPSMQYTVTFTDLDPATEYRFTIRIVLRTNTSVDVVTPVNGMFMTTMTPTTTPPPTTEPSTTSDTTTPSPSNPSTSFPTGAIVGIIVGLVVGIPLLVVVIAIIGYCIYRHSTRTKSVKISSHEMADQSKHKLTDANGEETEKSEPPASDSNSGLKVEDIDVGTPVGGGATGGGEGVIYADLDLGKGGKKPAKPKDSLPSGGAGKDEEVQYATIATTMDKPPPESAEPAES